MDQTQNTPTTPGTTGQPESNQWRPDPHQTKATYITVVDRCPPPLNSWQMTQGTPRFVQFFDQSQGDVDKQLREFGDGNSSSVPNPTHLYNAGTYTVRLTAKKGAQSNTITKTAYHRRRTAPTAAITASKMRVRHQLTVQFTDASTGAPPLTWAWDFGDGGVRISRIQLTYLITL